MEEEDGWAPAEVPTLEDVQEAARLANIHAAIEAMPQGYDTVRFRGTGVRVLTRLPSTGSRAPQ